MSTIPFALSTDVSSGIGTIFRDLLRRHMRNFLPVARTRETVIEMSKEIRNESVASREIPCPLGDWPAELWATPLRTGH